MKTRNILGVAAAILMLVGTAWAGSEERLGTGGAPELRLPVGARSIAMGGAALGSISGVEALFYNPAGIANDDSPTEVMFSHTQYIADMDVNFFGVTQTMGTIGVIGVGVKVLSVGEIPFTTEAAPDGTGEMFSPTFAAMGLSYAKRMTDRVNFGGTVTYVSERILQETAAGVAFDFGFQYDTGYQGMKLGMAMKNFGSNLEFSGSDFERNVLLPGDDPQSGNRTVATGSSRFELPSYFQLGLSYPLVKGTSSLTVHGLYQSNSYGLDEGDAGAEWMYRRDLALRAGYRYTTSNDFLYGLSYGAGVRVPLGTANLWVDYAGQQVSDFFDDIQHVAVSIVF
jgi:hypothetical protein